MRNWLASTPQLWPELGQREPTKDRPVCSVSFGPEVTSATIEQLFKTKGPYFHRLDKKVARIILYNNFIRYPFSFFFHEEGEAFQLSEPEVSRNEQCTISSSFLGMPVMGKTISKAKTAIPRKTFVEEAEEKDTFDLANMLIAFPQLRSILKDIHLKSEEEIQARARLITEFTPKRYKETIDFQAQFKKFDMTSPIAAKGLSNILLSYIAGGRVKSDRIDMQLWTCNCCRQIDLKTVNEKEPDKSLDEEKIDELSENISSFFTEWMISTTLMEIVKDYEKNGWRMNTKYFPRSKEVVRIMTPVSVSAIHSDGARFSHQFVIFWQIRKVSQRYILEYGIIDNIKSYDTGMNLDHVSIFQAVFEERMRSSVNYDDLVADLQVNFLHIRNKLPVTNVEREGIPFINYSCVSLARRAIVYGCIFYDLNKISKKGEEALEDLTPFGIPEKEGQSDPLIDQLQEASAAVAAGPAPQSLTPAQTLFRNNINFYVHHMFRMLNWLTNSPLLWPAPGQVVPTAENPLCSITFGNLLRLYQTWEHFYLVEDRFFHKNDLNTSYIVLYDNWQRKARMFWFYEDGEVFRERRPNEDEMVSCTISSRLDMPVMNKPSFKKPSKSSFEDADIEQHDEKQFRRFFSMRRRTGKFVSDLIRRSGEEIDHRIELLENIDTVEIPFLYREYVNYWKDAFAGFEFEFWISGTGLSEILLSYLLGRKVKNPHVKMEFSSLNTIDALDLAKMQSENVHLREPAVLIRKKTEYINKYFLEWLSFTGLDVLLQRYIEGGYRFNYVQFPRDVWVIRKMTYLDIALIYNSDTSAHEIVVFWQIRRTSTGFALEYGFIDNIPESDHEIEPNVNMKRIFERQMHYFLSLHLPYEQLAEHLSIECVSILNNTPWYEHEREGVPDIKMTCTTCAKRALLYGAMFYDITKLSEEGDKAIEDLTPFGLPEYDPDDPTSQPLLHRIVDAALRFLGSSGHTVDQSSFTPAQHMYRSNVNFYVHHMYRMMNWLATSPLIWPEPGQKSPTAERPVCSISLGPYRKGGSLTDLLDETSGTKFHKNTSCMAYIFLYDPVRRQPRKFWFHEEGEVFREEQPVVGDVQSCSISARLGMPVYGPQLGMPVYGPPTFKKDKQRENFYRNSDHEDKNQYRRFADLRPEIENMVSSLKLKTEAEIQARSAIVERQQLHAEESGYMEHINWKRGFQDFTLNSIVEGSGLSDVLMSYMLGCKIKNPHVQNTFSAFNTFSCLYLSTILDEKTMEMVSDSDVQILQKTWKRFFREWLIFTNPGELVQEFMRRGYSFPLSKFPINCRVLRRVTVLGLNTVFNSTDPATRCFAGHELLLFWQIRKKVNGYVFEYGFIDNLPVSLYEFDVGHNLNFHQFFQDEMRAYLSTFHDFSEICSQLKVEFVLIENSLPGAEMMIHNKISINFLCKAIARRALMYCSILYDIRKIASVGQDALETLVPVDFDHELESMSTENHIRTFYSILTAEPSTDVLSPSEKMFRSNVRFYVHHMFRMFNWLSTSPLIWPEPGQMGCTESRPVCQISFGEERLYKIDQDLFEEESSFFHNNDKSMAYIVLFNSLRREHKKFWFHEDGEVFRVDPPAGQDISTCSISSAMHITYCPFLDAPVPQSMAYHRDTMQTFKNPQYVEDLYTSHLSSGPRIPDDYLDEFCKYLAGLWEWITDSSEHYSRKRSRCSIMYCEMDRNGGEVNLNFVDVRPCAAKHNFYKIFIFFLVQTVRSVRDLRKFVVCHCYPENSAILSSWKFRSNPADKDMKNYWMLKDDMQNVTLETWKLKDVVVSLADGSLVLDEGRLPTAEMLNSQEYVDVYYPGKDHEAAVRAMEWARAADQEVPDDIFGWDDDRDTRKRPHSDYEDSDRAKREKLRCDLGAPVPKGMKYHEFTEGALGNPDYFEQEYADNLETRAVIPDYYLAEYVLYLDEMRKWIVANDGINTFAARCSVIHFEMNYVHDTPLNEIQLELVDVRPCAEGHGLYKLLLYVIIQAVMHADKVGKFTILDCLPENAMILSRLGFKTDPRAPARSFSTLRSFWMTKDAMADVTFDSWKMGRLLETDVVDGVHFKESAMPTAEMLNSQAYVDEYAATKDHAAAVAAMRNSLSAELNTRLGMPVKKTTAFKPKTPEDFTQMTKDEDEIQYERFSRLRPEIDSAVSVVVTKTDAEIQARDQISASLVVPAQYRESKAAWNAHFQDSVNNSTFIGAFFSDILMSYMVTSIVRNPLIKMDFYGLNNKCRFEIWKFNLNPYLTRLDPQFVRSREILLEQFFLEWLDFTKLGELLHDYVNKGGTFSVNQFPRKTLVIRKTICMSLRAIFPNTPPKNLEFDGHEILIFWQIRKTEIGHITEFGIIDNLPKEHYEVENGLNIDFFTMFQGQMRVHLAKHVTMPELRAVSMRVVYMRIQNNLPLTKFDRPGMPHFCFQCTTAARRGLLYLSIFYDISKLVREAELLEDLTVFGLPVNYDQSQDPLFLQLVNLAKRLWRGAPAVSYTDPQLLFRSNVNFYVHHMYRMMNWIATTPLIWPEHGQTAPTESHPMCQITFDAERRSIPGEFERFLIGSGPHFHKKTMEKTFITLYDCYRQTPRIFWFHEDGEPFREERPCMDDKHRCSVQSEFFLGVKKINKEKTEKKSDVLAIRDPPKFKRDWTERTAGDDSDQLKRFLESRPDITNFVENVVQKNFLSVIYRMNLLDNMSIPEEYQESVNSHVCYAYTLINAQETGTFVSDILLSYLFYHRTSNERINFQAHQFNTVMYFNLGMKNVKTNQPLPDEQVQVRRDLFSQKITEWLEFSRIRQYFEDFQANDLKFSDYIFNEEILVVRRVVFNDIIMLSNNKETGHENMMYWEFRKLPEGSHCDYAFQYGFIDNMHEFSYAFERNNIDVFELLKTSMESLLRSLPNLVQIMGKIQVSNVNIRASHPMKDYSHKMSYTCMTSCRRTMLYASFFYDINKVGQRSPDRILEDMTDFGMPFSDCARPSPFLQRVVGMAKDMYRSLLRQPPSETAAVVYTPQQKMFRSNVNFYIHHLFRMYNWLVSSPLIWPSFLQMTPTADRPICAVTFGEDRCNIDAAEMFKQPGSHFHVLDRDHARLILYDNFRKQPRTFWFHEDGEAFQEEMPEEGSVPKCVIQASMN